MTIIQNYPSGTTTSFVAKINELEKLIFAGYVQKGNIKIAPYQKKRAIKKIKTIFCKLDNDIRKS